MEDQKKVEAMRAQEARITEVLSKIGQIIMILSGKGGVGKSSIAANIAVGLSERGKNVGLMDVDLHGPSIPRTLGLIGARMEVANNKLLPLRYSENLGVLSIENLLDASDRAVIWRGPLKIHAIRQFLADVDWGELDYLVVDSPPGTGDEPLTIAQTMLGAKAIVVTTPQDISLSDVRKSITFCRTVGMEMLGLIENMSGYVCPHCGAESELFGVGGGKRLAEEVGVKFLGRIPFDPEFVRSTDEGKPYIAACPDKPAAKALWSVVDALLEIQPSRKSESESAARDSEAGSKDAEETGKAERVVAVPLDGEAVSEHFGHAPKFALFEVKGGEVASERLVDPPGHQPGVIPSWLAQQGATAILTGGMGTKAVSLFESRGIEVVVGVPKIAAREAVGRYLRGELETGESSCHHD